MDLARMPFQLLERMDARINELCPAASQLFIPISELSRVSITLPSGADQHGAICASPK